MSRFITVTVLSGYFQSGERILLNCDHITIIKKRYDDIYADDIYDIYTNAPDKNGNGYRFRVSHEDAQRIFNIIGASL